MPPTTTNGFPEVMVRDCGDLGLGVCMRLGGAGTGVGMANGREPSGRMDGRGLGWVNRDDWRRRWGNW